MKKVRCLLAVLTLSVVLTGCGTSLTDEQNRIMAEYVADLLLKYDANYQSQLTESVDVATETETEATTEVTTSEENVPVDDEPDGETAESEEVQEPVTSAGNSSDIAEILGLEGVSITYNQCMFLEQYPSLNEDGTFIYLEAEDGYQLVVLKFDIVNLSSQDVMVDLLNTEIDYKLVLNGDRAAKPMLTILMDDLGTFEGTVPANGEQSAVLVFQMSENLIDEIESLVVHVTYENEEHTIYIQ